MWSRDGRELFYRNGEKMMAVDVSAGADSAGPPTLLFEGRYQLKLGAGGASNYDVTPNGQGFVMIRTDSHSRELCRSGHDANHPRPELVRGTEAARPHQLITATQSSSVSRSNGAP